MRKSITTILCTALVFLCTITIHGAEQPDRPNFLIIVTDDQGYADLGAYKHHAPDIRTPNMDRIADWPRPV